MTQHKELNSCTETKSYYTVYSTPQAAALWCGVPEDQVAKIVNKAELLNISSGSLTHIWTHPGIECLEPNSRAITEAIFNGSLPATDERSKETIIHTRYQDLIPQCFYRRHFKAWLAEKFPNQKPALLFDDVERGTAISIEEFKEVRAERDDLQKELSRIQGDCKEVKERYNNLREEKEAIKNKLDSLMDRVADGAKLKKLERMSYLNMIAVLLKFIPCDYPKACENSSYSKPSKLINEIVYNYYADEGDKYIGLSLSNLFKRFTEGKGYFESNDSRVSRK